MTTRSKRDALRVQLLDATRMKELSAGHPLMEPAFEVRERELRAQIEALPLGDKEARTVLFFSGEPVQGSMGIDVSFASRVTVDAQWIRFKPMKRLNACPRQPLRPKRFVSVEFSRECYLSRGDSTL